jgi:hypothetical protein
MKRAARKPIKPNGSTMRREGVPGGLRSSVDTGFWTTVYQKGYPVTLSSAVRFSQTVFK